MSLEDIPANHISNSPILKLISDGSQYPTLFLPNYGEFGSTIHKLIRMVYFFKAPHITVCCKRGEESYFPTANDFFYDWNDCIEEKFRWGFYTKRKLSGVGDNPFYKKHQSCVQDDFKKIKKIFPEDTNYIHLWKYGVDVVYNQYCHFLNFDLKEKNTYGIDADIIISPRNRTSRQENNFDKWEYLIKRLNDVGFSVGCVGSMDQSFHLDGSCVNSWDYDDNSSSTIELLRKCKLYVGLDTGVSHLASFMSVPMIVFSHANQKYYLTHFMKECNKRFFKDMGKNIDNADKIIDEILIYFKEIYGKT